MQPEQQATDEQMPWDVAHNRQHPLVQLRSADLATRQFGVYANHIDHVSAKDGQMFLRQRFHHAVSRLPATGSQGNTSFTPSRKTLFSI